MKNLKELLEGVNLSEETFDEIESMISNKVAEKIGQVTESLQEEIESKDRKIALIERQAQDYGEYVAGEKDLEIEELKESNSDQTREIIEDMSDKLDMYTGFVVDKFLEENKAFFIQTDKFNRMKSVFDTIKEAFEVNGFNLRDPSDKLDEMLFSQNEQYTSLMESYNDLSKKYKQLILERETDTRTRIFEDSARNLAETQKERISKIINTMNFKGLDDFSSAVKIMVNEALETKKPHSSVVEPLKEEKKSSAMDEYLKRL